MWTNQTLEFFCVKTLFFSNFLKSCLITKSFFIQIEYNVHIPTLVYATKSLGDFRYIV